MQDPLSVPLYAITGGPCGGKSTAEAMLMEQMPDYGERGGDRHLQQWP